MSFCEYELADEAIEEADEIDEDRSRGVLASDALEQIDEDR